MDCTLNDIRRQINELLGHTTNGTDDCYDHGWSFLNSKVLARSVVLGRTLPPFSWLVPPGDDLKKLHMSQIYRDI